MGLILRFPAARYARASFANSDSADLAEIAYGNRMEIAYVGASFANSVSADLAEIACGNRAWKSRMEIACGIACGNRVWKSRMEMINQSK